MKSLGHMVVWNPTHRFYRTAAQAQWWSAGHPNSVLHLTSFPIGFLGGDRPKELLSEMG